MQFVVCVKSYSFFNVNISWLCRFTLSCWNSQNCAVLALKPWILRPGTLYACISKIKNLQLSILDAWNQCDLKSYSWANQFWNLAFVHLNFSLSGSKNLDYIHLDPRICSLAFWFFETLFEALDILIFFLNFWHLLTQFLIYPCSFDMHTLIKFDRFNMK